MPASLIRSSAYAIVLAVGLASPQGLMAAERPALHAGAATPLADTTTLTGQGSSVSVSNMNVPADKPIFLIVGAESAYSNAGAATIFGRVDGNLRKVKTLKESDQPLTEFGKSVSIALNGDIALVGAPNYGVQGDQNDGPGSAFLYRSKGKTWQKATALNGTNPVGLAHQGEAVFISPDGSTAFVGGPGDDSGKGAVWVYKLTKGAAVQQAKLVPNDSAGQYGSRFGVSISSSKNGNRVVIGGESDSGKGAVWIFERSKNGTWTQSGAKITATDLVGDGYAGMGTAVAMTWDGNTFAVSAPYENNGQGAVYIYNRSGAGTWSLQQKLTDSNPPAEYGMLGVALALQPDNGATIVASEPYVSGDEQWYGRILTFARTSADTPYSSVGMATANPCNELGRSLAISQSGDGLFAGSPQTSNGSVETGGTCFYMRQPSGPTPWMQMGPPIIAK